MILIFVNRPRFRRLAAVVAATALLGGGCGSTADDDRPFVVVSTTVLGDLVSRVAGAEARVEVLLPIGVDPHDYQPSAREIASLSAADLVVTNGLGLEAGLADALAGAAADGVRVLEVAALVAPLPFPGGVTLDPHVWLDPVRMADAAGIIAAALAQIAPAAGFDDRGSTVAAELLAADAEISNLLRGISAERRMLVTNHEALQYFAARYGFTVIGVVVPGGSTLAEPSSAELAALVEVIRRHDVPAIFVETTSPSHLAAAVAAEVGSSVQVVELHVESLGEPGSPESSLAGMLVENARRIAAALGG
ncbi:MAG: zinc ABC transporter substrate-binding protein [Acidimicrobiia bacterium]|nr:zinc ABC transporter substrate-binding protein [Acidimicrobiia bacterium]